MTCHFIDEETYFRQSYVIGCIRIKGSHNYQHITEVIMDKLLNSTVDNLSPTHTSLENGSNQKQDRKSIKSMYFYMFQYNIPETLIN